MPPRARRLTEADQQLWATYAGQVAPLRRRRRADPPDPAATLPASLSPPQFPTLAPPLTNLPPQGANPASKRPPVPAPLAVGNPPGGIDKATWHRFQSGKLATARTLDLHGMTVQRAYHALVTFLRAAHAEQVRCVEVVTGRGSGETGGVIRREFPHWLNLPEIRPLILAAAHPHALNPGSVRLILRRMR